METVKISTKLLLQNEGQIEGLASNPRIFTKDDVAKIAASLKETPELFEMRPCIVYPLEDKYIILAGNLRYCGAVHNKEKKVPCIVVPADTPVEKLKEIVIKDNGTFGAWNYDQLANEWSHNPLAEWGVVGVPTEDEMSGNGSGAGTGAKEFGDGDFSENMTMHLKFNESDAEYVRAKLGTIDADPAKAILKLLKYEEC